MTVYSCIMNSNAAPFFSDVDSRFIEAESAKEALERAVKEYRHPCGLYAAKIETCEEKPKMVARYLSAKAARQMNAPCGVHYSDGKDLFVDGIRQPDASEKWEYFEKELK